MTTGLDLADARWSYLFTMSAYRAGVDFGILCCQFARSDEERGISLPSLNAFLSFVFLHLFSKSAARGGFPYMIVKGAWGARQKFEESLSPSEALERGTDTTRVRVRMKIGFFSVLRHKQNSHTIMHIIRSCTEGTPTFFFYFPLLPF